MRFTRMGLLVSILILLIVLAIIWAIVNALPLPPPFKTVAWLVMLLVALIWVLEVAVPGAGGLGLRGRF